jgi:hypothetical protein
LPDDVVHLADPAARTTSLITIGKHLERDAGWNAFLKEKEQGAKPCSTRKKEQGTKPCSKNCVDPISPKIWICF